MKIDVYRFTEGDRSILGRLTADGGQFCFTLEPSRFKPVHAGHPCIPAGTYKVVLTKSPHLGYVTPELLNVPGRSEIRIHKGNKPEDSLGCTLVGKSHGHAPDWISDSHDPFDALVILVSAAIARREAVTAEYHDLPTQGTQETTNNA